VVNEIEFVSVNEMAPGLDVGWVYVPDSVPLLA
jgi:hypothetical protein